MTPNLKRRAYEAKKRDPRFLEEKEEGTAAQCAGDNEGPTDARPQSAGEGGKAASDLDEIRAARIIARLCASSANIRRKQKAGAYRAGFLFGSIRDDYFIAPMTLTEPRASI